MNPKTIKELGEWAKKMGEGLPPLPSGAQKVYDEEQAITAEKERIQENEGAAHTLSLFRAALHERLLFLAQDANMAFELEEARRLKLTLDSCTEIAERKFQ